MDTLNVFSAPEVMKNYVGIGVNKTKFPVWKLFILGIIAGVTIGFGGVVSNTAGHAITNLGLQRVVGGLLFPFGLGIVMLTGSELFTGNCMIVISALDKKATWAGVFKNWVVVYLGNFVGSFLLAAAVVAGGHLDPGGGALAVQTIRVAALKCSFDFMPALILGILCNVLVCIGVLCSLSAKDTPGRIMGAYIPVAFFVIAGLEHSIANMYFVPAGLLALLNPSYAALAAEAGVNVGAVTWGNFIVGNLVPVTIGNIIGGAGIAILLWVCHARSPKKAAVTK